MVNIPINETMINSSLDVSFSSDGTNYAVLDSPVITKAGTYKFIITAKAGYYITSSVDLNYSVDSNGTYTDNQYHLNGANNKVNFKATYTNAQINAMTRPVKIAVTTVKIPDSYHLPVTWNIEHASTPDSEDIKLYNPRTVTITADDGYIFKENGELGYTNSTGIYKKFHDIIASGTNKQDVELNVMGEPSTVFAGVTIKMPAQLAPVPERVTYNLNLSNATADITENYINLNQNYTINFTASENHVFDTAGSVYYFDGLGEVKTVTEIPATNTNTTSVTFDLTGSLDDIQQPLVIKLDANVGKVIPPTEEPSTASLTLNLTGIDSNINDSTINLNETYNFTFTPKTGYKLNNNGTIAYFEKDSTLIKTDAITVDNELSKSFSITPTANTDNITITMVATVKKVETISVNQNKVINATSSVSVGDSLTYSKQVITFTASDNCIFDKAGYVGYYNDVGQYKKIDISATNTNTAVVTVDFTGMSGIQGVDFVITATQKAVQDTGGFTNIYNPTSSEVNSLMNETISNDDVNSPTAIDPINFTKVYYRLPFAVPTKSIQQNVAVVLGKYKATTTVKQVLDDTITFDIGSITTTEKYGNAYDYLNAKCTLYLPFVDSISLPVNGIIANTINIKYVVDMYTGTATINITNNSNDVILSKQFKLSTDLPLIDYITKGIDSNIQNTFNNTIKRAYLVISRLKPKQQDNYYPTLENGKLINYTGYVKCSTIQLNNNIDNDDQLEIESLLNKGVYIK